MYYVTFIDDFSRKTWIYLLKDKDEAFGKFREFKVYAERWCMDKVLENKWWW